MPELPEVYPPLDLTLYTEATRREVYAGNVLGKTDQKHVVRFRLAPWFAGAC